MMEKKEEAAALTTLESLKYHVTPQASSLRVPAVNDGGLHVKNPIKTENHPFIDALNQKKAYKKSKKKNEVKRRYVIRRRKLAFINRRNKVKKKQLHCCHHHHHQPHLLKTHKRG